MRLVEAAFIHVSHVTGLRIFELSIDQLFLSIVFASVKHAILCNWGLTTISSHLFLGLCVDSGDRSTRRLLPQLEISVRAHDGGSDSSHPSRICTSDLKTNACRDAEQLRYPTL